MGDGAAAVPCRFRTICVFCGSSAGHRKVFADAALELGHELVSACVCVHGRMELCSPRSAGAPGRRRLA